MKKLSPLDAEKIKNGLRPGSIGSEVLVFDAVKSTNDLARRHLEKGAREGLVLIADSQFSGRGRMGRSWISPPGVGVYLSVLLKPRMEPKRLPQLTLLAGLAAALAVNEFTPRKAQLKWPNDVLLNGKKCSGILCEYHSSQNGETGVIVGVGINANHSPADFPEELKPSATSLKIETRNSVDRPALIRALLRHLDREYSAFQLDEGGIINRWMENTDMFGKSISVARGGSVIQGAAIGLDPQGKLTLLTEKGEELALDSGEVSLGSNSANP